VRITVRKIHNAFALRAKSPEHDDIDEANRQSDNRATDRISSKAVFGITLASQFAGANFCANVGNSFANDKKRFWY
jgi:hypothetical protein